MVSLPFIPDYVRDGSDRVERGVNHTYSAPDDWRSDPNVNVITIDKIFSEFSSGYVLVMAIQASPSTIRKQISKQRTKIYQISEGGVRIPLGEIRSHFFP
jgi:hypothetical protein